MSTRREILALSLCLTTVTAAAAQTTPTQRAAAKPVLDEIDALQARLEPARLAQHLASRRDADRDRLLERVASHWRGGLQSLSDWIGRNPEVGFAEHKAADTLSAELRAAGFTVERGVADLPTAFVARWTSPAGAAGPTLGLIGEYDALRGTQGAYHGDQHNAQTPVAMAAAYALKELMTEKRLPGRIVLFGTPAEEVGPPPKTTMWQARVFEGTDILVRSHGTGGGTARARPGFGVCCLNIDMARYVFTGRPSHQRLSWQGRNALEAAVMFFTAVDQLRSSLRPEASIQGVIPEGGTAPNIVPDRAVVDYYLRYPDEVYLAHVDSMIANAARGAALATGTTVAIEPYGSYRDGITLGTLEEAMFAFARQLGAPRLQEELDPPQGYEETGWVSRDVPGVSVSVASSTHPNHSYEMTDDGLAEIGHTAFLLDAKIEAAILYEYLTNATFRDAVRTEHATMTKLFDRYIAGLREAYADEIGKE